MSESVVASNDEICTLSSSSMNCPADDQFSLCCDDQRFTKVISCQRPESKFPLNEVINKSLKDFPLQSCGDPTESCADTKKFMVRFFAAGCCSWLMQRLHDGIWPRSQSVIMKVIAIFGLWAAWGLVHARGYAMLLEKPFHLLLTSLKRHVFN